MKKKINVFFRWSAYNHYTLSALIGLLDEKLDPNKFTVSTFENTRNITPGDDEARNILAYSFTSIESGKVKEEIQFIRSVLGDKVIIVCGGPHTTAEPEEMLKAGADLSFIGESEESLPDFLNSFYETGNLPEKRVINPLPLASFDDYPPFAYKRGFFGPIELRRGCFGKCTFCQTSFIHPEIRERSIEYAKKYVRYMKDSGRDRVLFTLPDVLAYGSDNGGVNLENLEYFLSEVSGLGINILLGNFPSEVSPDKLAANPGAARILRKYVTNTKVVVGAQSASEKVLKIMRRKHNVEDIMKAVEILRDNGFKPIVDILFGVPGEKREDRMQTLELMKMLIGKFDARPSVHYFIPLPGTPLAHTLPEPVENDIKKEVQKMIYTGTAKGDFFTQMEFSRN
ncbi:MAG: TIGR04013 family B12-binding domain/radical SAM domain-containing protein [Endomicrobiales bacterium]|nr:TIGR04013 family B12-binding domain/radical SAM domain-containing protein [Endomicrobiales bacterium]